MRCRQILFCQLWVWFILTVTGSTYFSQNTDEGGVEMCRRRILKLPEPLSMKILPTCEIYTCPEMDKLNFLYKIKDIFIEDKQPGQGSTATIIDGGLNFPQIRILICTPPKHGYSYEIRIVRCALEADQQFKRKINWN